MKLFSQRMGLKPAKSIFQVDSMDDDLRNALWSALKIHYWDNSSPELRFDQHLKFFCTRLWIDYFKLPLDTMPSHMVNILQKVRKYYFEAQWYEVYDFIEFVPNNHPNDYYNRQFIALCNSFLERELSAFRFVGSTITKITDASEINEIDEASDIPVKTVREHLRSALSLLSDRKAPDYRNSIKESVSALESLSRLICSDRDATLGEAIKLIEKQGKVKWHPALKGALDKLYGYASDEGGIRHGLKEEDSIDFEEAKFMLVTASAFVNYLIQEASKAGIKL
jgi:hypothetical protein